MVNGEKLVLGEGQDVSDKNYGVLVFEDERNPEYIQWSDIEEIKFK